MRRFFWFFLTLLSCWLGVANSAQAAGDGHHALPLYAPVVLDLGFFQVTNSMVALWLVALAIIAVAQCATRNIELIPNGLQNFLEAVIEGLQGFLASIMGEQLARQTFWFFGSVFIFILAANWMGLLPSIGTIGHFLVNQAGEKVYWVPWLRGANADVNTTLALALTFFGLWLYWAIKHNGPGGFLAHLFVYRGEGAGFIKVLLVVIFFAVGILEVISILIRPLSLTFRLYGNIYAGENLLELMHHLGGWIGWLVSLPFYFLELMVGLIQAVVFTILTAVFTSLMCEHHDEEHAH